MNVTIRANGKVLGQAGAQLLSNNIEAYENTIPAMLSDRLRNPKFSGPENVQTGIAAEWETTWTTMPGFSCRLIPGMYLSGHEAQLIHNYALQGWGSIVQAGVRTRKNEEFEVEMWARAQHRPVDVTVELGLQGRASDKACNATMNVNQTHWQRYSCRIASPGDGGANFHIRIPGDSRVVIDQIHLRPVAETHVSEALLDAFGQFPCPVLRFPGGCISCTYHWKHGTGPVHLRPVDDDPVFKYKVYYDFGTDEYLELCNAKGIRPFITLNTTTATPDDAAGWAAYVRNWFESRSLPIPAAYFMFGNENHGTWEIGHMTGEMYAAQLRAFIPVVRDAYPEARMLAIGEPESTGLRPDYITPWRSVLIDKAADLIDVLVVTRYVGASDDPPLAKSMEIVADSIADKTADLQWQAQSIRDAKLACTMGIVEWNYITRASHSDHAGFFEPHDIRHCLYAAGYLNAFCRMGDILELANFYSLVNTMGMLQIRDGQLELTDLVKVFNLYADALPGDVLALEVDAPALTEKSKAVDANFLRKADATYGFLVNYSATDAANVSLAGLPPIREARGLSATAILEPLTEFAPTFTGDTLALPPMSLVRVRC